MVMKEVIVEELTDYQLNRFKFDLLTPNKDQLNDAIEFIRKSGNKNYFRRKGWSFNPSRIVRYANYLYTKNNYKDYGN